MTYHHLAVNKSDGTRGLGPGAPVTCSPSSVSSCPPTRGWAPTRARTMRGVQGDPLRSVPKLTGAGRCRLVVHGSGGDRSTPGVERELGRGSRNVRRPNQKIRGRTWGCRGVRVPTEITSTRCARVGGSGDGGRVL